MIKVTVESDNGEKEELHLNNLILLGKDAEKDGVVVEYGENVSISEIAAMLLSGSVTPRAVILANSMKKIKEKMTADAEVNLLKAIMGGIENGTDS